MKIEVTLTRAHKIIERLNEDAGVLAQKIQSLGYIRAKPTTSGLFDKAATQLTELQASRSMCDELIVLVADIKIALAKANVAFGVSAKLTEVDMLNRMLSVSKFLSTPETNSITLDDVQVTQARVAALQEKKELTPIDQQYLNAAEMQKIIQVGVAYEAIQEGNATLKKKIRRLTDEISDLNRNKITIEISEDLAKAVGLMES